MSSLSETLYYVIVRVMKPLLWPILIIQRNDWLDYFEIALIVCFKRENIAV